MSRQSTVRWVLPGAALAAAAIGGRWLLTAGHSPWALPLLAALAGSVGVGVFWRRSRARARRWEAALAAYAEREIARAASGAGHADRLAARTAVPDRPPRSERRAGARRARHVGR